MDADDLAPGTIRTRVNNLRSVLRAAVRDRIIALDPGDGVTLRAIGVVRPRWCCPPRRR